MADPTTSGKVTVDSAALAALVDVAHRCIEVHARAQMDTPEDKARHARAVEAMRESLATARAALGIEEAHRG